MVRILQARIVAGDAEYIEAAGLSTDDKPTGNVVTGSTFLEVDTGDVYAYDEEGDAGYEWCKIASLGGGDSNSGGGGEK